MYPKNNASPERLSIGVVVQISDGAVQTTGCSVTVTPQGGSESAGGGTLACLSTSGVWTYIPTQAETNYTSFIVSVYKTGCIPATLTVITTANSTAGRVSVGDIAGTAQTGRDIGASVLLSSGTGTGQLDFTSGVVKANLAQILGTALTETAGYIAAGFKQFFNIATPAGTINQVDALNTRLTATRAGYLDQLEHIHDDTDGAVTKLNTIIGYLDTEIAAILADTNELQTDWTNGGRLDLLIDAIKAKTDNLPTDPADDSDIDAQLSTIAGYLDTEIAALTTELAKVPKSDSTVSWNATALAAIGDAVADEVQEGSITLRQIMRLFLSVLTGKSSGGGTATLTFRDIGDTKDRLVVTVDANGNRTAVTTRDGS